jgi:hypothetical protein
MPDSKKSIKFAKQQKNVLDKLLKIIGDENILYNFDRNDKLQKEIMELSNEVRKYYSSSNCSAINNKNCKKPYLTLLKFILKKHGYKIKSSDHTIKLDSNIFVRTKKYQFINNSSI